MSGARLAIMKRRTSGTTRAFCAMCGDTAVEKDGAGMERCLSCGHRWSSERAVVQPPERKEIGHADNG